MIRSFDRVGCGGGEEGAGRVMRDEGVDGYRRL